MTCSDRDRDLLLLAHGKLPLGSRLLLENHLRGCASCRRRREEMAAVSRLIAGGLRDPDMAPWVAARARFTFGAWAARLLLVAAVAVFLFGLGRLILGSVAPSWPGSSGPGHAGPAQDDGCRPGLPNDRCR